MLFFTKKNPEAKFWKWFEKNSPRFQAFEADRDQLIPLLSEQLSRYKEGLTFEVGVENEGVRDLVISADGVRDLFYAVHKLTEFSPQIPGWRVVAFRPRMDDYTRFSCTFDGRSFDPKSIWFHARIENNLFDIIIYHSNYEDTDRNLIASGTYILLDMALGEYDVVTGIHYIDHQLLPANPESEGLRPFSDLRKVFDDYKISRIL